MPGSRARKAHTAAKIPRTSKIMEWRNGEPAAACRTRDGMDRGSSRTASRHASRRCCARADFSSRRRDAKEFPQEDASAAVRSPSTRFRDGQVWKTGNSAGTRRPDRVPAPGSGLPSMRAGLREGAPTPEQLRRECVLQAARGSINGGRIFALADSMMDVLGTTVSHKGFHRPLTTRAGMDQRIA